MATMYSNAPRGRLVTFLPHGHNHLIGVHQGDSFQLFHMATTMLAVFYIFY